LFWFAVRFWVRFVVRGSLFVRTLMRARYDLEPFRGACRAAAAAAAEPEREHEPSSENREV
jgi:hypothetical protein